MFRLELLVEQLLHVQQNGLQEGKSTSQEGQRGSGQRVIRRGVEAREDTEHASDAEFSGMRHAACGSACSACSSRTRHGIYGCLTHSSV